MLIACGLYDFQTIDLKQSRTVLINDVEIKWLPVKPLATVSEFFIYETGSNVVSVSLSQYISAFSFIPPWLSTQIIIQSHFMHLCLWSVANGGWPYLTCLQVLATEFGLTVKWNGQTNVEIMLNKSASNTTCGLCGNFDGRPDDDWTIGPSCKGSGRLVTFLKNFFHWLDFNVLGKLWTHKSKPVFGFEYVKHCVFS